MAKHHKGGRHRGGSHKSRGFRHKGSDAPAAAGHVMTPDQEKADRMANRAANQAGQEMPFGQGGPMAGPAPAAVGGGQAGPPGQDFGEAEDFL